MSLLSLIVRWGQIANFWKKPSSLFIKESELQTTPPFIILVDVSPFQLGTRVDRITRKHKRRFDSSTTKCPLFYFTIPGSKTIPMGKTNEKITKKTLNNIIKLSSGTKI